MRLVQILITVLLLSPLGLPQTTVMRPNSIRFADQFPGSTADAKISAAIADLPATGCFASSPCGVVDARGLTGAQTIAATVTVSSGVNLILGCASYSGASGVTPLFKLAPGSGLIAVSLEGQCASPLNTVITANTTGGVAVQVTNDTRFVLRNLKLTNALTPGTTAGLAFTSLAWGCNTGTAMVENVAIVGLGTGVHIGTATGNLAACEMDFRNLDLESNTVGVLIQGTSSIDFWFRQFGASRNSTAFRFDGDTTRNAGQVNILGAALSDNTVDIDLRCPLHFHGASIYSESSVSHTFRHVAPDTPVPANAVPTWISFEEADDQASSGLTSVAAWPGSYSFRHVRTDSGLAVGDPAANRYHVEITGVRMPEPAYVSGSTSLVYVSVGEDYDNGSHNTSVHDNKEFVYPGTGTARTLYTYPWSSASQSSARPSFPVGFGIGAGTDHISGGASPMVAAYAANFRRCGRSAGFVLPQLKLECSPLK